MSERPFKAIKLDRIDRYKPDRLTARLPDGWVSVQYALGRSEYRQALMTMGALMFRDDGTKTYEYSFPSSWVKTMRPESKVPTSGTLLPDKPISLQADSDNLAVGGPIIKITEPILEGTTQKYKVKISFEEVADTGLPEEVDLTNAAVTITSDKSGRQSLVFVTPQLQEPKRFETISLGIVTDEGNDKVQVARAIDDSKYGDISSELDDVLLS